MIQNLRPYPTYKDSGLPWVGLIPEHWEVHRGKSLFAECALPVSESDEIVTCFRDGQVTLRKNRRTSGFMIALKEAGYQGVRKGQLVIHAMDAFAGAIGVSDSDGKCTPEYIVCRPRSGQTSPGYFAALLRKAAHTGFIQVTCAAVRERAPRLRYPNFGDMRFPVPPADEQAAILRFLDYADRRIRRAVRAKRNLIALLNEQKQVIVRKAISKGVNDDATYRATGIPWIGDIPAHWTMSRVKTEFICLNNKRVPLSSTTRGEMTNRAFDYYGASSVIDRVDDFIFDEDLLLIAEDGANLVLRNLPLAIIARGQYWVNNHAHVLRPRKGNLEFLSFLLESINYLPWISGAAQPKLTKDRLLSIPIAVPPLAEQDQIVKTIRENTENLSGAINRTKNEVQLLLELRTRLVSDVVIGKLDVRDASAQLPAEELTTEPTDDTDAVLADEEIPDDADAAEVEA